MSNTINLPAPASISTATTAPLTAQMAPLASFCTLSSTRPVAKTSRLKVITPRVVSVPVPVENPTNFMDTDTGAVVEADETAAVHLVVAGYASNSDLQDGIDPMWLLRPLIDTFAATVWGKAMAIVTTPNFGAASLTIVPGSFGTTEAATLLDSLRASRRSLVLDTKPFAAFAPALSRTATGWAYPGFDSVHEATTLATAEAGTIGFEATPEAVNVVVAPPATPAALGKLGLQTATVALPGLGVSVMVAMWASTAARSAWVSIEGIIGASKGNAGALKIIKSA